MVMNPSMQEAMAAYQAEQEAKLHREIEQGRQQQRERAQRASNPEAIAKAAAEARGLFRRR